MRATDIIRSVLDLIDAVDTKDAPTAIVTKQIPPDGSGELVSRFKQVYQVLANRDVPTQYSNSPNEVVTDTESVTTDVGGGPNKIKHPDDIRIKDPRGFN